MNNKNINSQNNPVRVLRIVGNIEGASFLILLLIAMPLKYFANLPQAVRIVGSLHGFLFVIYLIAALRAVKLQALPLNKMPLVFIASVIPLGPFLLDHKLRPYEHTKAVQ